MKSLARSLLLSVLPSKSVSASPETKSAPADRILINGKVLTVDENFSTAQAIAISGERIAAVGTNEEIRRLSGPNTTVTDLDGKTVIPGLIDNHVHYFRGVPYWRWEAHLDAVNTRKRAMELIAEKAVSSKPGEWVLTVGGWNPGQFTDSNEEFTREELDRLVPNNPVFVQYGFQGGVANSMVIETLGIDSPSGQISSGEGPFVGFPPVIREALPLFTAESWKEQYLKKTNEDYNRAGITTVWEAGAIHYPNKFTEWAQEFVEENGGWSNVRIFHHIKSDARDPEKADRVIQRIKDMPPLEQGDYFRFQGFGEMIYRGTYDMNRTGWTWNADEEALGLYRKLLEVAAEKRWPIVDHTMTEKKFDAVLDILEDIDKTHDIKPLRWSFHHCDQMKKEHLDRAAKLNMFAGMHVGHLTMRPRRKDQPPMRTAQKRGITWGLGTDAKIVSPYPAFFILYVVVSGKGVAGNVMLPNETVSREEALIAYTRSNAWMLFMEDNLGSIEPGKYADIVVLDRDYMTCPEEEIRDIESVLTLVGGRVGYEVK
jgi:hypothetical protein